MTEDRPVTASPEGDQVRVELGEEEFQLDVEHAEAFRNELSQALEQIGPNRIRDTLNPVDGVGTKTADLVAEEFRTLKNLRGASGEEIEEISGVGPVARMGIQDRVQKDSDKDASN